MMNHSNYSLTGTHDVLKKIFVIIILSVSGLTFTFAQVGLNADGTSPDSTALLDLKSADKGLLLPRMTVDQRDSIHNPVEGLMIYCTNCLDSVTGVLSVYQGGKWLQLLPVCDKPDIPAEGIHIPQVTQITWNWDTVPIARGYKWNSAENYNTAVDLGLTHSNTETGLTCWSGYSRYVWAYNDCGPSFRTILADSTLMVPFSPAPSAGAHSAEYNQIVWNWDTVPGATGYKWNTCNNFFTAENMETSVSKTETNLLCDSAYTRYVWAYDACGYSQPAILTQATDTCLVIDCQSFTDIRDGQSYFAVLIDTLCWMGKNLNYGTMINSSQGQTNNDTIEKYCYYDLDSMCTIYGALYQWREMMQYDTAEGTQGICPDGWHLPSHAQWLSMFDYLGGSGVAGGKLKEAYYEHWQFPNMGATNESGFTALPGGIIVFGYGFAYLGYTGKFWSSKQFTWSAAGSFSLYYDTDQIFQSTITNKYQGLSVRCIKD
jgi:uncharacterized protein (TIGR02145 family)